MIDDSIVMHRSRTCEHVVIEELVVRRRVLARTRSRITSIYSIGGSSSIHSTHWVLGVY